MTDKDWRERLLTLRVELETIDAEAQGGRAAVELDQQRVGRLSRMNALQAQAMNQAVAARRKQTLQKIEAALVRLEDGEFGYCVRCGDRISEKRLDIDPTTAFCADCTTA